MEPGGASSDAIRSRLLDWLGEVGPRWGLPADACRVHGQLYLVPEPASTAELAAAVELSDRQVAEALDWLRRRNLVEEVGSSRWKTAADPWQLVTTALEHRRARELPPALALLRASRRDAASDPILARQIGRLLDLVEDIALLDAQVRRLSPATLRGILGMGGRVARLFGAAGGGRR